ncbi:MAG: hypothetical protein COA78_18590 [Blastopirellula sp.]|nr:MAG: hypothetical protein COA78_18590 [Blastopirellula sp.]
MTQPVQFAFVITMLTVAGCDFAVTEPTLTEPALTVKELEVTMRNVKNETEADVQAVVDNAAAADRAIMFINLDWSVMAHQIPQFAEFSIEFQKAHPDENVMFHFVDCTPVTHLGYKPLRALDGWKELEVDGGSLIHGWGEVAWLEHGHVLHVQRIDEFESTAELIEFTERLMKLD